MKALIGITILMFMLPSLASAQTPNSSRGQGYLFFGLGARDTGSGTLHIGGGGEGFVRRGLGLGAEIGAVWPWSGPGGEEEGLASVNLSYHFLPSMTDGKFEPFITAGYSMQFRAGIRHGANAGIGANVWLRENLALRLEGRGHVLKRWGLGEFRIGVTIR